MTLLAGVGVGGAVGSIIGALVGMGIPEYEAVMEAASKAVASCYPFIAIRPAGLSAPRIFEIAGAEISQPAMKPPVTCVQPQPRGPSNNPAQSETVTSTRSLSHARLIIPALLR
jgi:hypothetical protein